MSGVATIEHNVASEAVLAWPAQAFTGSKVLRLAYRKLYPNEPLPWLSSTSADRSYWLDQGLHVLTPRQVQAVNSVGLDALPTVTFHVVPTHMLTCVQLRTDGSIGFNVERYVLQRLVDVKCVTQQEVDWLTSECSSHMRARRVVCLADADTDMEADGDA